MTSTARPMPLLLNTTAYITDLTLQVGQAKKQISLMSLILGDDTHTHELIEALIQAAGRGVAVSIALDVFTYAEFGGHFSPFQRHSKRSRGVTDMVAQLRTAGATVTWLGSNHKINPFAGVTHIKWTVVDDTTYCFGGVNLYTEGVESVDYMLKFAEPMLAQQITEQHTAIIKSQASGRVYAGLAQANPHGTTYIDSGQPRKSHIYDRLCELAVSAEHVIAVTQYCPSGPLAKHLQGKSDIYYNQSKNTPYPSKLLIAYDELRTGLHSRYTRSVYLHAKYMLFTMPGGKKIAMTGSHNFSHTGVVFGTREVALETDDPGIISQLEQFHQTYVARS